MSMLNEVKANGHAEPLSRATNARLVRIERQLAEQARVHEQHLLGHRNATVDHIAAELAPVIEENTILKRRVAELERQLAQKTEVDAQVHKVAMRLAEEAARRDEGKRGPKGHQGERGARGERGLTGSARGRRQARPRQTDDHRVQKRRTRLSAAHLSIQRPKGPYGGLTAVPDAAPQRTRGRPPMMPTIMRSLIGRAGAALTRAAEGAPRPGPYHLPITGGILPAGAPINWWQTGISPVSGDRSAMVEACVSAYSQTTAMLPGDHWRANDRGGRDRVTNSALSRILQHVNSYQTISDFLLNAVRSLYLFGNFYALALRNARFEVSELHLCDPGQSSPLIIRSDGEENGEIFYRLGGNDVIAARFGGNWHEQLLVPARDVMHARVHCERQHPYPLVGSSPLVAAYGELEMLQNIRNQQTHFWQNRASPSAVLTTDLNLDKDQVQALRDRWNESSKGMAAGSTPILTSGLKVMPWVAPALAKDMQIAELMKLSNESIALAFRIPLQILGLGTAPLSPTHALMQSWLSLDLGFCLNHVEQAFDRLFGLAGVPEEFTEFDTAALLRSDQKDRIEALVRGVQGALYSPNEARNMEGLDSVPFGDEPRTQAQNTPLSAAANIPSLPAAAVQPSAPAAKDYQADYFEAMQARAKTLLPRHGISAVDGNAEPRHVIRKVKANVLQRPTF